MTAPTFTWTTGHLVMSLTLKAGPRAGTTLVNCTCGWERTYATQVGARRGRNAHLKLNGVTV